MVGSVSLSPQLLPTDQQLPASLVRTPEDLEHFKLVLSGRRRSQTIQKVQSIL